MKTVYLVRHGQTEWNKRPTFRGRMDVPLNETGHRQAAALRDALKDKNIDAVYTSPLTRSIETAQPTATFFHLEITPVKGLIDISYGDWEGLALKEVRIRYGDLHAQWEKTPNVVTFPHGETLDEVRKRSFDAFTDIVTEDSGNSILIIPHRVINKVLLCALLGLSNAHFWKIRQDTGCINVIDYSGDRFVLSMMNDTCHLKGIAGDAAESDF